MAKAPTTPTINTYNFTATCKSGQKKSTTFTAANYNEARAKLQEFVDNN